MALGVETEQELLELADRLEAAGVPLHRVVESDGPYRGQLMALGIEPGPKSQRRRFLSSLPLLRMENFDEYNEELDRYGERIQDLAAEIDRPEHRLAARPWWSRLQQWWRAAA